MRGRYIFVDVGDIDLAVIVIAFNGALGMFRHQNQII
jgi:predicted lipid carrier protein YhbT